MGAADRPKRIHIFSGDRSDEVLELRVRFLAALVCRRVVKMLTANRGDKSNDFDTVRFVEKLLCYSARCDTA